MRGTLIVMKLFTKLVLQHFCIDRSFIYYFSFASQSETEFEFQDDGVCRACQRWDICMKKYFDWEFFLKTFERKAQKF